MARWCAAAAFLRAGAPQVARERAGTLGRSVGRSVGRSGRRRSDPVGTVPAVQLTPRYEGEPVLRIEGAEPDAVARAPLPCPVADADRWALGALDVVVDQAER